MWYEHIDEETVLCNLLKRIERDELAISPSKFVLGEVEVIIIVTTITTSNLGSVTEKMRRENSQNVSDSIKSAVV